MRPNQGLGERDGNGGRKAVSEAILFPDRLYSVWDGRKVGALWYTWVNLPGECPGHSTLEDSHWPCVSVELGWPCDTLELSLQGGILCPGGWRGSQACVWMMLERERGFCSGEVRRPGCLPCCWMKPVRAVGPQPLSPPGLCAPCREKEGGGRFSNWTGLIQRRAGGRVAEPGERPISEAIKNICTTDSREGKQKALLSRK